VQSPTFLGSLAAALIAMTSTCGCRQAEGAPLVGDPPEQGAVDLSAMPPELRFPGAEPRGRFYQDLGNVREVSYVLEARHSPPRVIAYYDTVTAFERSSKRETPSGTIFEFRGKNPREAFAVTIVPSTGKTGITVLHTLPHEAIH
jgi:hypothetical protein